MLTPSLGLTKSSDTSPLSGSVLSSVPGLIDGNLTVIPAPGGPSSGGYFSAGLDFGTAQEVSRIVLRLTTGGGTVTPPYWSTSQDTFEVYSSSDNSTWVLRETFNAPTLFSDGGDIGHVTLTLASSITDRYIKVRSDSAGLRDNYPRYLSYTEIQAFANMDGDLSDAASSDDTISAEQFANRSLDEQATASDFLDTTMDILDEGATASDFLDTTMDILDEQVSANDSFSTAGSTFNTNLYEEAAAYDSIEGYRSLETTVTDTLGITDVSTQGFFYAITNTDEIGLTETIGYALIYNEFITDIIFIYDVPGVGWKISVTDALVLTDTINKTLGVMIEDWITLVDTETNKWTGSEIVSDAVTLYDVLEAGLRQTATITESLVLTDTQAIKLTISVLEYLGFTDLVSAMKTMAQSVTDSVVLTDSTAWTWPAAITEALALIDTNSVMATFLRSVSESIVFADVASLIQKFNLSVNESLVLSETLSVQGTLYTAVYDTLAMNVTVELDGEYYETYVLNTPKFLPSMYSGFDFNSYAVYQGRAFGANDTGIFELTGTTDAGATIRTGVVLHETDFDSPNQKKFRRAYLDISGTAPKMIVETEDGKRRVYDIDDRGKSVISHEMKGKYWKLSISDFQELESVKIIPVILSK